MEIEPAAIGRALLYLGIPFVLMVFYYQWRWARTCDRNIQVLVAQESGGGVYELAPKSGGHVTIPYRDGTTRIWPVNELATIEVTYPGVGFVPAFLQKKIRQTVVNEGDWEPMLNRSPHHTKVASPDVVDFMLQLMEDGHEKSVEIKAFLEGVATGPTRELIGDPAMLGSLMQSGVMQALASVSDDLMDALNGVRAQLARVAGINSVYVYGGLGVCIVLLGFIIYQMMQGQAPVPSAEIMDKLNLIQGALGLQ